ncbi:hypothetical protein Baya_9307 [Bagarius yarrelli]|uniref:Uncharacterized protein n=1 Tax=Bagarius yarrelli TaxID=175774 RepID=A0A556U6K1_BAGYA|nr:hypothetical protein Baya_9307 [Bagarius yarrelli]
MDPFGQYGYLGPVFPFGRPCMSPYQFMQYPGYVVPHAPMQATDYRRAGPLFPSVASYDLRFRQHFQQMSVHRETTSSEVQTEPGDSVSKLMDSLENLKACEKSEAAKQPKVMFSSTPAISFTQEVDKMNYGDEELNIDPASRINKADRNELMNLVTLCDSAVDNVVSSQGHFEECVLSDVLPLDSSFIRDERQSQDYKRGELEMPQHLYEKYGTNLARNQSHLTSDQDSGAHVSDCNEMSDLFESRASSQSEKVENLPANSAKVTEPLLQISADCGLPYQILRLPCNKTTTGLLLQKDLDTLLYMDAASMLPSKQYPFGSTCVHNYYPQVAPARQSVLGPSLDELSSRDEMFSTDVEDDPPSGQTSRDGGKLDETSSVPACLETDPADEACSAWAKTCACCGASLPDEDPSPVELLDQDCDTEFEEATEASSTSEAQKILLMQHSFRHDQSPQESKFKAGKMQEVAELGGQDQDHGIGECGEEHHPATKGEKGRGRGQKGIQFRSYSGM